MRRSTAISCCLLVRQARLAARMGLDRILMLISPSTGQMHCEVRRGKHHHLTAQTLQAHLANY